MLWSESLSKSPLKINFFQRYTLTEVCYFSFTRFALLLHTVSACSRLPIKRRTLSRRTCVTDALSAVTLREVFHGNLAPR